MSRKKGRKKRSIRKLLIFFVIIIIGVFVARNIGDKDESILNLSDNNDEDNKIVEEVDEEKYKDKKITIVAVGDIMFHESQIIGGYNEQIGAYDFKRFFDPVKEIIESADIAVANFEGTTAGDEYPYKGWPNFNAPDEAIDAIKYAGFDILTTANNHSIDTGKMGIIRTIDTINQRDIDHVGTYTEKPETRILLKEVNGIKLAFLSYTYGCNLNEQRLTEEELDYMVNIIDKDKISKDISDAKEANVDIIIACMHWGNEYQRNPSAVQRDLTDFLFNEGVNIILGSHPHVIQDSKTLQYNSEDVFVAYSMGNFISNQRYETLSIEGIADSQYTEDGVIIKFEIEKEGISKKTSIKSIGFIPTWVYRCKSSNGKWDYRVYPIMEYIENSDIDEKTKTRMQRSYNDTMSKMNIK